MATTFPSPLLMESFRRKLRPCPECAAVANFEIEQGRYRAVAEIRIACPNGHSMSLENGPIGSLYDRLVKLVQRWNEAYIPEYLEGHA